MKYFSVLSLLALGVVAISHGFVLMEEKKNLVDSAVGIVSNLKDSAQQKKDDIIRSVNEKKDSIIESVKEAATNKWDYVKGVKEAQDNFVRSAVASQYSKLQDLKNAKQTFVKTFIDSNTAKLANAYSAVSNKFQGLHQYKLNLKDKATSLVRSAARKIHSEFEKKKELFSKFEKSTNSNEVVLLQPVVQKEEPLTVQTYVRHEPAVVGTVYVPEFPVHQIYEETPLNYGPPANTYGPGVIPI